MRKLINTLSNKATIFIIGLLVSFVAADQPVNCLRQQFHDQWWSFHVSKMQDTINIFEVDEVCTH